VTAIVRQVAEALGDRLRVALGTLIAKPPTVIIEPPGTDSIESGAAAIMFEEHTLELGQEAQIDTNEAGDGPAVGGDYLTPEEGAALYEHADGVQLTVRGTMKIQGRIWVGARLAPKREVLEERVLGLFFEADGSQGRMDVALPAPLVDGVRTPWDWPFVVLLRAGGKWQGEMTLAERLWSFIDVDVEVSILQARRAPLVTSMIIADTQDITTTFTTPAEADAITHEEHAVDTDGSLINPASAAA